MNLTVELKKIPFVKESGSGFWGIFVTNQGTAKGNISWSPKVGEKLKLVGDWTVYNGQKEFKFKSAMPDIPKDSRTLLHYVCEISSGIGIATEQKIWDELGDKWEAIENDSIKGLSKARVTEIKEKLEYVRIHSIQVEVVSYLLSKGLSMNMAEKAWMTWEKETIGIVNSNCYRLTELKQVGFSHVDDIVRNFFDIKNNDPRRIKAGIAYAIKTCLQDGSTVVDWGTLSNTATSLLCIPSNAICNITAELIKEGELIGFPDTQMITTKQMYYPEKMIWEFL